MGCTSSTESAAAVVNAAKDAPASHSDDDKKKNREKKITAGTETMAISSHHDENGTRIDTTTTTTTATTAASSSSVLRVGNGMTIRYACLSQRGRDPEDASKPNQDCYSVHETLLFFDDAGTNNKNGNNDNNNNNNKSENSATALFFGVYDGHGPHGHACSQFVQERLPDLVQKNLMIHHQRNKKQATNNNKRSSISIDQVHTSLHEAHTDCNDELRSSQINDSFSGTTSVTLYIHKHNDKDDDSRITVCNVGDSRAVLGTKTSKKTTETTTSSFLQAVPLSKDQTPHRSDEAARCVRSGARILSFGEINPSKSDNDDEDSEVEDPPRVWSKKGKYPGTAFTRSIGDAVAEKLGVFAEPEMLTIKISPNEKLVVLASDGVFDVMTNQQVVDLVFQHKDDPTKACQAVIEKSHHEWLQNEECADEESASYDDMTITCIFIDDGSDDVESTLSATVPATTKDNDDNVQRQQPPSSPSKQPQQRHPKRVRQKTLRNLEEMEGNNDDKK